MPKYKVGDIVRIENTEARVLLVCPIPSQEADYLVQEAPFEIRDGGGLIYRCNETEIDD